jgi:hypothetical protein
MVLNGQPVIKSLPPFFSGLSFFTPTCRLIQPEPCGSGQTNTVFKNFPFCSEIEA